jgi:hypothetical protein
MVNQAVLKVETKTEVEEDRDQLEKQVRAKKRKKGKCMNCLLFNLKDNIPMHDLK